MTRIAIIGAGFGGIGAAVRLKQAGADDLVLLEKGHDVGGVWRDNSYPGAACDVPSHLYSFSFAPQAQWSRRFAPRVEIHAYLRAVAADFDVLRHVRFSTEVLSADFDEPAGVWRLRLSTGEVHEYDVVVAACGQLSRPAVPALKGLDTFAGTVFHSADWKHDHDMTGRKVAVIGTGASAIQFVPEIAPKTVRLTVFQRSAPYVIRKPDREYGARTRALLQRAPALLRLDRLRTYCVNEARSLGFNTEPRLMKGHELRFRRHLRRQVPEPVLRAALTPTDPIGCKRILQSNGWYPALTLPQVELVTDAIAEVRPDGVVTADGRVHEADTIVLGTGFAATELLAPMQITGRGGRRLTEAWSRGAEAYLGTTVSGFPNLFLLYGPNTNLGHNSIVLMLESQIRYLTQAVAHLREGTTRWMDVRADVMASYNRWLQSRLGGTVFAGGCRSWYLTADGRNTQNWPGSTLDFRRRTRRLRLADYVLQPAATGQSQVPSQARRELGGAASREPLPVPVVRNALWLLLRPVLDPRVPVKVQRAWMNGLSAVAPLPAGVTRTRTRLGGRPAERLQAGTGAARGAILLLHGGAFITGSRLTHRVFAGHLAAASRVPVHVLDYRLAPEHPYPAPVDDALAAYLELAADGPVVVVGDSAGGTLALLLAQRLRDGAGPAPAGLGLVSPLVDLTLATSDAYVGPDPYLRSRWAHQGRDAFVGTADARALSPLHGDLTGLPPVLVHVSGHERLRPEGEQLVDRVRAAGGEAELVLLPGLWHDVHLQSHLVEEGARATADLGRWAAARLTP